MRISKKVLCAGAVIIFGTAFEASAQTGAAKIRACVLPSGNARIVGSTEPCKANETVVEWSASGGAQGPPGPQGPQGPQGPAGPAGQSSSGGSLHVFNASGGDLGPMLAPGTVLLTLPSGRKSYAQVAVTAPANGGMNVYYTSTDCSGDAYIAWNTTEELVPQTIVLNTGAFAIVPGSLAARTVKMKKFYSDTTGLGACQAASGTFPTSRFDFYLPSDLNLFYPLSAQ
jgi:hypothetical protein